MSHTHTSLCFHVVFATKHRIALIRPELADDIWSILWDVCSELGIHVYAINGGDDHAHILMALLPNQCLADVVRLIKSKSTREIRSRHPDLDHFAWQRGYGAFTFSHHHLNVLIAYVRSQPERDNRSNPP
ncbi:MAG: IS200/IS605 family transposase [Candidatus Kapabacteria bacterium]|nr:IS200/IS605 family transposase [Candidatus Kapabacteria bacterium]